MRAEVQELCLGVSDPTCGAGAGWGGGVILPKLHNCYAMPEGWDGYWGGNHHGHYLEWL